MHIDAPKGTVTSVRDFAGKYAMFVISILTALMLEHAGQKLYHYKIASEASEKIDDELRANLAEIRVVRAHNEKQLKHIESWVDALGKDLKLKLPDARAIQNFRDLTQGKYGLSLQTPTLRHEAWDVAVANQSASHMPPATLRRYSQAYARLRDEQSGGALLIQFSIDGPQLINVLGDLAIDQVTPRALFHMGLQMRSAMREAIGSNRQTDKEISALIK